MVVNSIIFWIFFAAVLLPYFTIFRKSARWQNIWLLVGSLFFYGYVEWKMIPVLLICIAVFFLLGRQIGRDNAANPKRASALTTLGVVAGVGILVYFKYLGFLVDEFAKLLSALDLKANISSLKIIMPLGVSYFTFKLISYLIEVHREKMAPCSDPIAFGVYISFFPTIMAGPIDRPDQFLPQLKNVREAKYDNFAEGTRRIVWGLFLKMCIADQIVAYADAVFLNYTHHNTSTLIFASILYAIQMYSDFCGYSHMAIGVGQIMGLKVKENFNRPFLAQNVAEMWRRWHISLTTWITDYVYMPLNIKFRNLGKWGIYLAILINMVVVGAWHGANWTFVLFGVYQGLLMIIVMSVEKRRKKLEKKHSGIKTAWWYVWGRRLLTFLSMAFGMIIFRSSSVSEFFSIVGQFGSGFGPIFFKHMGLFTFGFLSILIMLVKDWKDEEGKNIHFLHSDKLWVRLVSMAALLSFIVLTGQLDGRAFIYFQF